jgi:hypothetical protein
VRERIWIVLSWAVTSESVLGRLGGCVSAVMERAMGWMGCYYFSTHGCRRFGSCFVVGTFKELAVAAACCRAFMLKKSAMAACCGC